MLAAPIHNTRLTNAKIGLKERTSEFKICFYFSSLILKINSRYSSWLINDESSILFVDRLLHYFLRVTDRHSLQLEVLMLIG